MARAVAPGSPWNLVAPAVPDTTPLLGKLAKYVPAEALAAFLPFAAMVSTEDGLLWLTWVVSLVVGLLLIAVQVKTGGTWPRWWYWPMVVVAFGAWSIGASDAFRAVFEVSATQGAFAVGLAAVALPVIDSSLETLLPRRR